MTLYENMTFYAAWLATPTITYNFRHDANNDIGWIQQRDIVLCK